MLINATYLPLQKDNILLIFPITGKIILFLNILFDISL